VILRPVSMHDHRFILECNEDWPVTDRGPATSDSVTRWIRRWMYRDGETCLVATENATQVGYICYRQNLVCCKVDYLLVHPFHRGKGKSSEIVRLLRDKLIKEGVVVAEFDALPGVISSQIKNGKYLHVGEKKGFNGPLVVGQLTQDMKV